MSYVVEGAWPHARLDGPLVAHVAQEVARRLATALAGRSMSEAARVTGVDRITVTRVLAGVVAPDLGTLVRLSRLGVELYPSQAELDELARQATDARGPSDSS